MLLLTLPVLPSLAAAELVVSGVGDELERNIRAFVALDAEPCDSEPWRVRRRFRNLEADARRALEPFGHYNPAFVSSLAFAEDCWRAELRVDPGPAVRYRHVEVAVIGAATDDPVFQQLLPPPLMQGGAELRHAHFDDFKEQLQIDAIDRGYVEARFTSSQLDIWPDELAADVSLAFESGPRYNFGDVHQDQSFLTPALVDAFLSVEPGTPYDAQLIAQSYRDLSNSGYFSRIELVPEFEAARDLAVPIRLRLEPAAKTEYTVGVGFSTDTGPRFRAGYRNRRVNAEGHRFNTELRLSSLISGISAEYRKPLRDPRSEWLSYTASVATEETDSFDNDTFRLGARRSKRLTPNWIRTQSIDLAYDRFDVGGVSDESRLLLPGLTYDHKRSDLELYPTRGRRLTVELRGTHEIIGSDTSFLQLTGRGRWIRSFGENTRLLARATAGVTAKTEFDELPPSVRFFAGGDESVRGFDIDSLGPEDADGNVVGGSNLLVASLEAERRLRGNFYGALFVDAGNAFDGTDVDAAVGAGLGLKWRSPVGPVRLYLAHPFNKSDDDVRIHVRLGADL